MQIKSTSGVILFEDNSTTIAACVIAAIKAGANLLYADLQGANLLYADLQGAYLQGAYLQGANLQGANLQGANLLYADLQGAYLQGANLQGADLVGEKLTKTPIQIYNLQWDILITDRYMKIGCQRHTHKEWGDFRQRDIVPMSEGAWDFWKQYKTMLIAACKAHSIE